MSSEDTSRAFVLGFDGVPWNLIEQWTDAGELPNFRRLREEGAAGPLESTTPATTALAWPTIATGVGADQHGIYAFQDLTADYSHRMHTSGDVQRPALWHLLSPAVVGNVPMTYPPDEIDGEMVAGMMTPSTDEQFTHPPDLGEEIRTRIPDYRVALDWSAYGDRRDEFVEELTDLVEARRALMQLLGDRDDWRLFFFVYTAPDRLQHLVWDDDALLDHYRHLDDVLGDAIDYADEHDADLYVVSDHGFGPVRRLVAVNRILEREGYLQRRCDDGARSTLADLGITRESVLAALDRVGIDDDDLLDYVPRAVADRVATKLPGEHVLYDVDYANTTAFVHGDGNLYVNDARRFAHGTVAPNRVPDVRDEVRAVLDQVTDPETGKPALDVADADGCFPADDDSPDLVVTGRDGYDVRTSLTDETFADPDKMAASHRSEGVFLAWGPNVESGVTVEGAHVADVAPTVLHGVGESVPRDADGDVLHDVFVEDSPPGRSAVARRKYADRDAGVTIDEEFGDVEDRLRGLGYME